MAKLIQALDEPTWYLLLNIHVHVLASEADPLNKRTLFEQRYCCNNRIQLI